MGAIMVPSCGSLILDGEEESCLDAVRYRLRSTKMWSEKSRYGILVKRREKC